MQMSTSEMRLQPTAELVEALNGRGVVEPAGARRMLVERGPEAVPLLVGAVRQSDPAVRWEAAKALAEIGSPASIHALIGALMDEDGSVRWIAAEGLARIGREAIAPLLTALMRQSDQGWLRDGAHHVLRWLARGELTPILKPVLRALESWEPDIPVMYEAARALERLHALPRGKPPATAQAGFPVHTVSRLHMHPGRMPWHHLAVREFRAD